MLCTVPWVPGEASRPTLCSVPVLAGTVTSDVTGPQ